MDLLLGDEWLLLVGTEVSFWALLGAFLVLRCWSGSDRGSLMLLTLIFLGALGYPRTGEFAGTRSSSRRSWFAASLSTSRT